jgi:hypothetical protein
LVNHNKLPTFGVGSVNRSWLIKRHPKITKTYFLHQISVDFSQILHFFTIKTAIFQFISVSLPQEKALTQCGQEALPRGVSSAIYLFNNAL